MKKWQIAAISAAAVVVALIVGGSFIYKYYIIPKYIEPVVNKVSEYLQDDDVIETMYDQAVKLHDEGVMDDEVYNKFINAYKSRYTDEETEARQVLREKETQDERINRESSTLSAKYASNKVGVEMVQTNDGESLGGATRRYSSERTSDRIKAEDVVEAQKIVTETEKPTEEPDMVKSAYAKLKENMTSDEYADFVAIMRKLDIETLKTYINDKEGLKEYLHSNLNDDEYKRIVNLGYKYVNLFIEE